jgi:hypothetical protein
MNSEAPMIRFFGRFLVLLASFFYVAEPALAASAPPEIKNIVAFVFRTIKPNQPPEPWGTAFFVSMADPKTKERQFIYLVTAKHVLQGPDGNWLKEVLIRLNTRTGTSEFLRIPIVGSGSGQTVFLHPTDPAADVAVIPGVPDEKRFDFKVLPNDFITSKKDFEELKIREGSEVFFTGLFSPHVGTLRNYPIVRFGKVALITEEKIKFGKLAADLYLVETGSYGGNSGSPVFFNLGSDREPGSIILGPPILKLAGVMSGTFLDVQPLRAIETATIAGAPSNMGIAAVVPAYKLLEILLSPALARTRSKE